MFKVISSFAIVWGQFFWQVYISLCCFLFSMGPKFQDGEERIHATAAIKFKGHPGNKYRSSLLVYLYPIRTMRMYTFSWIHCTECAYSCAVPKNLAKPHHVPHKFLLLCHAKKEADKQLLFWFVREKGTFCYEEYKGTTDKKAKGLLSRKATMTHNKFAAIRWHFIFMHSCSLKEKSGK